MPLAMSGACRSFGSSFDVSVSPNERVGRYVDAIPRFLHIIRGGGRRAYGAGTGRDEFVHRGAAQDRHGAAGRIDFRCQAAATTRSSRQQRSESMTWRSFFSGPTRFYAQPRPRLKTAHHSPKVRTMLKPIAASMAVALVAALTAATFASGQLPPGYIDPAPILAAAAQAIGADRLTCVTIAGTAYGGAVGQQREAAWNVDWPRIDQLANYTRTMNWETRTITEDFERKPGLNPA